MRRAGILDRAQAQRLVQTAQPVAAQIDGDIFIPHGAEPPIEGVGDLGVHRARQLVTADFDPRERVVMSDAEHPETEAAYHLLGGLDAPELFVGHFRMVRDARGQARGRGLVPCGHPGPACQLADLGLGETRFVERTDDSELAGGLTAWAVMPRSSALLPSATAANPRSRASAVSREYSSCLQ